ncbi:hypothetical protein DY000_02049790 [Brassica cretica]|uniref:Thioredoxin domain-containing protein n=1 Tax=Brassica cretica TaxID=69181 RepID=A0ABQ7F364_BRACR|nr:hypothetical protein DY000_02049790 [Brassica cretica]
MRTPALLLLLLAFVSIIPPSSGHGEWGILTEQNFSSQIRLHPHILLFVTAPWCGESRSLKNEITQLVHTSEEYGSLKLMVVYRNSEKVLAQAIGASNEITILYYHHAVPHHYRGKLRASNILSSLHPYLTSPPQELPLRHLKSPESLKAFLESSDKTLILFEFCGWTSTLLSELKRNVTEDNNLWHGCGESRSLKNEITQLVHTSEEYGSLKLMVVYRNSEKVLAQAIGASNEITILYYHHAVPHHYRGKLRASNILSSLHPYLTSPPQELPLRHLKSPESLKAFLESSDKTLILFEFCGWTSTLLSELKRNVTEDNNLWHGNFSKKVETDRVLKLRGKNNQKVAVTDHAKWKPMCRLQSGFGRVPWLEDFSYVNDTAALQENDRANGGSGQTCNHEQYKQFSSFLSKLIAAAKEFSLPPERQKFGLIAEKSLASPFTVGESDSWTAVLQLAGCPHCSKILKAGDDIQRLLKMENPIVSEREVYPSVVFFPTERNKVILYEGEMNHSYSVWKRKKEHKQALINKLAAPKVKVGTIPFATERLGDSLPFAKSKILILKAGQESGFMGVIFNKRLRWSSYPDLDGGQTAELLKDTILSLGGPVMDREKPLMALSREGDPSTDLELSPGVYFLDHDWSHEQLFDEIGLGVWDVDNNQLDFAWP